MSSVISPSDQELYIDPYNGYLFDFDSHQSRVYLARTINNLLKSFGSNCIISGLRIESATLNNNLLSCTISPGKVIIDTTLIEYPNQIFLTADVTNFDDDSGYFIICCSFNFLHDKFNNFSKFKLIWINNNGISPNVYAEIDRIIITKLIIDKTNNNVRYSPTTIFNSEHININGVDYKIYPVDSIVKQFVSILNE